MSGVKVRLGDLLVQQGLIDEPQLMSALAEQRQTGRKLGATLIAMELVTEKQLLELLSTHLNVPLIDIDHFNVSPAAVKLLPEVQARRYRALVLEDRGDKLLVGMSDPADLTAVDNLGEILPKPIEVAVVSEQQLFGAYDSFYRRTDEIASFAQQLANEYRDEQEFELTAGLEDEQDTAVARLLQSIFEDAVQAKASDIHIEPDEQQLRIRQRVDGVLQETVIPENNIAAALVLRLKLMAGLDISEKRLPQDGRTQVRVKGHRVDVRLSTMPVQTGEAVVMRLLDQSAGVLTLEETGMPKPLLDRLRVLLKRPHGMILVTGPTGSGKSTTLAAMVDYINETKYDHILTVEDPIEFVHESKKSLVNQREVHRDTLGFNEALRSALREDPDVILVGEMRDLETIRLALTAAETGHVVFGTLHTSSAAKTIDRIVDVFPAEEKSMVRSMLSESLQGVISQALLKKNGGGRVAAHEIMIGTPAIRNLIREDKIAQMYSAIQTGAAYGMTTMDQSLQTLLNKGIISREVAREKAKVPENF